MAKCYKDNPSRFEDVTVLLMEEPFDEILVTEKEGDYLFTNSNYFPVQVKQGTKNACIAMIQKFDLISISKNDSSISFTTNHGMHKGDNNSLVYTKSPQKQIDSLWGRDYFTLNEHWAIYLH